jgi:hypothetical protein
MIFLLMHNFTPQGLKAYNTTQYKYTIENKASIDLKRYNTTQYKYTIENKASIDLER